MAINRVVYDIIQKVKLFFFYDKNPRHLLLRMMPKNSVCAEIGVWKGNFSRQIINFTSPKKMHLIDPWKFQPEFSERIYGGTFAKNQADMDQIYEGVKVQFGGVPNCSIHRGFSEEVLQEFPDNYFDWLYIDGNHYYKYVLRDLELALLKVRSGGFITGDDYLWGKGDYQVKRAVQYFVKEKNLINNLKIIKSQFIIKKI